MSLYTGEEQMEFLRARYQTWKDAGFPDIDHGLKAPLELLNSFPGVVTVSSCGGHPARKNVRPASGLYIFTAVNGEGFGVMLNLYQRLMKRFWEVYHAWDDAPGPGGMLRESFKNVHYKDFSLLMNRRDLELSEGQSVTYHCVSLHARTAYHHTVRSNFLSEMEIALNKMKEQR